MVARQAHNLKVVGSNPAPATKIPKRLELLPGFVRSPFPVRKRVSQAVERSKAREFFQRWLKAVGGDYRGRQ